MLGSYRKAAPGGGSLMANEIRSAVEGLASLLEGVPSLRVYRQPPPALNELPAAVVLFESRGASRTLGWRGVRRPYQGDAGGVDG